MGDISSMEVIWNLLLFFYSIHKAALLFTRQVRLWAAVCLAFIYSLIDHLDKIVTTKMAPIEDFL